MIASVVMKAAVVERPDTQSAHVPGSIHVLSPTSPIDCNLSPSIGAPILLRRRHGVQPGDDHALRLIIPAERCALRASDCGTTAYLSWDAWRFRAFVIRGDAEFGADLGHSRPVGRTGMAGAASA